MRVDIQSLGAFLLLLVAHPAFPAVTAFEYQSTAFSGTRTILVSLPSDYDSSPGRRYPVLYVLNGSENSKWAAEVVGFLADREQIDELIVVGLPADETYGRDNFPYAGPNTAEPGEWARRYETFIRQEAVPHIERTLRTNGARYIAGHSLSGLFVTNLFLHNPRGFNVHFAISPSYHQAPRIVDLMRDALSSGRIAAGAFYLTVGDLEHSLMRNQVRRMADTLKTHAPKGMRWTYSLIENNNHKATANAGVYEGLTWLYRDWDPTETMAATQTLGESIAHYDALARLLGYTLIPREGNTISLAGFLLGRINDPAAALNAYRLAHHFYPQSDAPNQMIRLLEPWLAGGAQAVRESLRKGAKIREVEMLDLVRALKSHGKDDLGADLQKVAAEFFPKPR